MLCLQECGVDALEHIGANDGPLVIRACLAGLAAIDECFFHGHLQSDLLAAKPITIRLEDDLPAEQKYTIMHTEGLPTSESFFGDPDSFCNQCPSKLMWQWLIK
jgi:hypothetical protein